MNCKSYHSHQLQAKLAGFMPTYWSAIESNDRTPETRGPGEDRVA
jgi:hypothetical protein